MSQKNRSSLQTAFIAIGEGLRSFVEHELRSKYGEEWKNKAYNFYCKKYPDEKKLVNEFDLNDEQVLLKVILSLWHEVFSARLKQKYPDLVRDVLGIRNAIFHNRPFSWANPDDELFNLPDTNRAFDSMQRLLLAIGTPQSEQIRKRIQNEKTLVTREKPGAIEESSSRGRDPYIHFQPAYLLTPDWMMRLDAEAHKRLPNKLGWLLIDACSNKPSAVWVHVRPYINDRARIPKVSRKSKGGRRRIPQSDYKHLMPQSFRLMYVEEELMTLNLGPDYVAVLVKRADEEMSEEAYVYAENLQATASPYFTVKVPSDSEKLFIVEEWGDVGLQAEPLPLRARRLSIVLSGKNQLTVNEYLPFDLQVQSKVSSAALDIKINDSADFTTDSYHFLIHDDDNDRLGDIVLRVDALQRSGRKDEITVQLLNSERAISVHNLDTSQITRPGFNSQVMLHLVFDRTTLDDASWPMAFETLAIGRIEDEMTSGLDDIVDSNKMHDSNREAKKSWNHNLRNALAETLPQTLAQMHSDILLCLWWFADIPRGVIAPSDELPHVNIPYGKVGECVVASLTERLNMQDFDYVTGYDLFDAVDEALLEIANFIKEDIYRNYRQHAVLIVGDSPPPPARIDDVLWRDLVEGDVRTNARCSDQFEKALKALSDLDAPVGWLFMRSKSPWQQTSYDSKAKQFQTISQFKEQILRTLQKVEGLDVKGCAGLDSLRESLSELLYKMAQSKSEIPGFQLARINPAQRTT